MTRENPHNKMSDDYNAAALAAARVINPEIPMTALPIIFATALEIQPVQDEIIGQALEERGEQPDATEILECMRDQQTLMWMPQGYMAITFADHNGTAFGRKRWCVALETKGLPSPVSVAPQAKEQSA